MAGGALVLRIADDGTSAIITTVGDAFTFAGDRPVDGELPDEAVTDLNSWFARAAARSCGDPSPNRSACAAALAAPSSSA